VTAMSNGPMHLFIPGPTNVPEAVRRAMNVPMQDHRAPDFPELTLPLFADLKKVFANETGRVFMYQSSGTGAWEAAISNTLNRGDRVLMSRFGQFSHLWANMAKRLGLDVICVDREWGEGVPLEDYARHLTEDKTIRGVFACHNETATGVTSDIAGVRRVMDAAGSEALLFVDAVSSLGSIPFEQEAWGVDLAVTGSQKGLMMPAGMSLLGVSAKALQAHQSSRMERSYFWICCSRRACRRCSSATTGSRKGSVAGWMRWVCRCAHWIRGGTPTPSRRSAPRRAWTPRRSAGSATTATARRSGAACPRSPARCSGSATWAISTR
jgi:aspartate aminotransferase-like enzyme